MTDKYDDKARELVKLVQTNLMMRQEGSVPVIAEALRQAAEDERRACVNTMVSVFSGRGLGESAILSAAYSAIMSRGTK